MYFLKAVFLVCAIIFSSCDLFSPDEKSDSVKIYPRISFAENNDYSMDSIHLIKVHLKINDSTRISIFNFWEKQGVLALIPINKMFTIQIFGCDKDLNVLYQSKETRYHGITDDTEIFIELDKVTPLKPINFKLKVLPDEKLQFTWKDNSRNEKGFYLLRKEIGNSNQHIDTIGRLNRGDNVVEIKKERKNYKYFIEAYNDAGSSVYPEAIEWYYDDTIKKIEEKLILPVKNNIKYKRNLEYLYFFQPESDTCPKGHKLQYKFRLNDDYESKWLNTPSCIHAWKDSGLKEISLKKRCSVNTYAETQWSFPPEIIEVE